MGLTELKLGVGYVGIKKNETLWRGNGRVAT